MTKSLRGICHLYRLRINTHVLTFTMPCFMHCFIARHVVALGGIRGFIRGACVVLFWGCAWFYSGIHVWFYLGVVHGFFSFFRYNEIRSMSARYASYWLNHVNTSIESNTTHVLRQKFSVEIVIDHLNRSFMCL